MPDRNSLRQIARTLHGIRLPEEAIGYTFRNDMSVSGLIQSPRRTGTLAHELFHLLVRNDFGDVPPWLDEVSV